MLSASRARQRYFTQCCSPVSGTGGDGASHALSARAFGRAFCRRSGRIRSIIFFHKLCAVVLTLAFAIHVKDIFTRSLVHGKGIFWGATSMVPNWKDVRI